MKLRGEAPTPAPESHPSSTVQRTLLRRARWSSVAMVTRSKREVAPQPPKDQFSLTGLGSNPLMSTSMNPGTPFFNPWWTAQSTQSTFAPNAYGVWSAAAPRPDGRAAPSTINTEGLSLDPPVCPPGGFVNLLKDGVEEANHDLKTGHDASHSKGRKMVIKTSSKDDERSEKRLSWTTEEDLRLVSAWLNNSNDPINGNNKKNDQYWCDVHAVYDITTPISRKRKEKHLKDRMTKIKRLVSFFCASWKKADSIYVSGQSDDMLRDKALEFYLQDYKEGPFMFMHCWRVLRNEPKWLAVLEDHENTKKRMLSVEGNVPIVDISKDAEQEQRPMGTKEAKKQRNGKGKLKVDDNGLAEDIKKYMDIQAAAKKRHEEFIEAQQRVSSEKVEVARLKRETTMLETYRALMTMNTSEMTEDMKAEHAIGLKNLRENLFGGSN